MKKSRYFLVVLAIIFGCSTNTYSQQWDQLNSFENAQVISDSVWLGIYDPCLRTVCPSVYRYVNFGTTVELLSSPSGLSGRMFHFNDIKNGVWANRVTNDSGATWRHIGGASNNYRPQILSYRHDSLYYGLSYSSFNLESKFIRVNKDTTFFTTTWPNMTHVNWERSKHGIVFINDSTGFLILTETSGINSHVLKTTDFGDNWNIILTDSINDFKSVLFRDSINGIITSQKQIYRTADGGSSWSLIPTPTISIGNYNSTNFYNDSIGYLASDSKYVMRTVDSGVTWNIDLDRSNHQGFNGLIFEIEKIIDANIVFVKSQYRLFRRKKTISTILPDHKNNTAKLSIYPNPSSNYISIQLPYKSSETETFVFDINGRLILTTRDLTIDISKLVNGTYLLKTITEQNIYHEKFIKVAKN